MQARGYGPYSRSSNRYEVGGGPPIWNSTSATMRTLAVVLVAVVLQTACDGLEYEVQEIGSAGHSGAELKESDDESAGGFFSALTTSGSMTMMQAGRCTRAPLQKQCKLRPC